MYGKVTLQLRQAGRRGAGGKTRASRSPHPPLPSQLSAWVPPSSEESARSQSTGEPVRSASWTENKVEDGLWMWEWRRKTSGGHAAHPWRPFRRHLMLFQENTALLAGQPPPPSSTHFHRVALCKHFCCCCFTFFVLHYIAFCNLNL